MVFELEKPNTNKIDVKQISKLLDENAQAIFNFNQNYSEKEYLYWDEIKYKKFSPEDFPKENLWKFVKMLRESKQRSSFIADKKGKFFTWIQLNHFEKLFHEIDMNTGGELFAEKDHLDKKSKQKLITRGIMEEAIASSQLEGAATSRQAAKKMLQEQRKPTNQSEQMILNNYLSMKSIEEKYKDIKMSRNLILELHEMITKDTTDSENEIPRLRKTGEPIYIKDKSNNITYYEAPDINFVEKEMKVLAAFANDELKEKTFIHPIIKAIMLHFWIGYLHPFTDGNGRLARLLFYWYLIKKGYWAFTYLPISKMIKKSPKQYIMAYVYSEQDDNDLTYFINYNLNKIEMAIKDFKEYLNKQSKRNKKMKEKSEIKYALNMRQIQLLQYLYGNLDERTTLKTHMTINQVTKATASKDLKDLVQKGFLLANKIGRNVYYYGTNKIKSLF